jgi:hypothetical protein
MRINTEFNVGDIVKYGTRDHNKVGVINYIVCGKSGVVMYDIDDYHVPERDVLEVFNKNLFIGETA